MTKNHVAIHKLVLNHGRHRALNDIDIHVPAGSVTALLGRNGAGKSTLLDCIIGLLPPNSGKIEVLGMNPWKKGPEVRQHIGYVEADPWFDPHEKVESILTFFGSMYHSWSWSETDRLCENFDLDRRKRVKHLSRGMRTKLALVVALAHAPKLLVLDEPFDGLDCGIRDEILAEVVRQVNSDRAIIIASHDLDEIERVADRVVVLHQGAVSFAAELDDLRARTHQFLGRVAEDFDHTLIEGPTSIERLGREVKLTWFGDVDIEAIDIPGVEELSPLPPVDLKEAFLAATGGRKL